jgi:hypothetical protein
MRVPANLAALVLLAGCGGGAAENRQEPPKAAAPLPRAAPMNVIAEPAAPDPPADLAGMSPRQRRAYEAGVADCRAGRYAPEYYPEAYRIGCAAAHDR